MSKADAVSFIQGVKTSLSHLEEQVFDLVNRNDVAGFVKLGGKSGYLFTEEEAREAVRLAMEKDVEAVEAELDEELLEQVVGGASNALTSLFSCKKNAGSVCTVSAECNGGHSCGW